MLTKLVDGSVATLDDEHMGAERAEGKNKDSQWKRSQQTE